MASNEAAEVLNVDSSNCDLVEIILPADLNNIGIFHA